MPDQKDEPTTWEWDLLLERVKRASDLGEGAFARFTHSQADIKIEMPVNQWIECGRPNRVTLTIVDGGAHAPVGA
jgi:hypothetical protein